MSGASRSSRPTTRASRTGRRRCPSTARRASTAPATSTARSSASRRAARTATQAWKLVKYLTTNTHALAKFSNGIRNVPSTAAAAKSKELKPDPNFATFTRIFVNPKSTTIPVTPLGSAHLETFTSFLAKWQAGKVKDLHGGSRRGRQADRRQDEAGGRRRALMSTSAATEAVPAAVAADRRRARRRAGWRRRLTVLAFLAPLARRLLRLLRLPARDERLALAPQLRPAQPGALGRSRELPLHVRATTRRSGRPSTTRSG